MKKRLGFLIFMVFVSIKTYSQCIINGNSTIKTGSEEVYSVDKELAQCKECHQWSFVGSNTFIKSDNRLNEIKVVPNNGGKQIVSLTVLTPKGILQCSKNIEIIDEKNIVNKAPAQEPSDCDIQTDNFKEVKYSDDIVSFFPNNTKEEYSRYVWTVNYKNGDSLTSNEKVPQFKYTKEENPILKVTVKIISKKCLKSFTKTYEDNYWKFF